MEDEFISVALRLVAENTDRANQEFVRLYGDFLPEPEKVFAVAVKYSNKPVAVMLYKLGVDINELYEGRPPFMIALENHDYIMIRMLLKMETINLNLKMSGTNQGVLSYAIQQDMPIDIILGIIYYQPVLNVADYNPLCMAVNLQNIKAIQVLLYFGANPKYVDSNNRVAGDYARDECIKEVMENWSAETTRVLQRLARDNKKVLLQESMMVRALEMELSEFIEDAFVEEII
jgi:hypothetical protein